MGALQGFLPFLVFALVGKLLGPIPGLAGGALASFGLLARDRLRGERALDLLEAGSAAMFTVLAALALAGDSAAWSVWRVRLCVDAGLAVVVAGSIAAGRPFTLRHARRRVRPELAATPSFLRTNAILSGVWALAFAVLAAADLLMVLRPASPPALAVGVTLAALAAAAWFTKWYPARARARAAARAAGSEPAGR